MGVIYDINGNPLSVVYDINGNVLSVCYDINGDPIPLVSFDDSTTVTNVYTSSVTAYPQGGCIDDDGNVYVCFYSEGKFRKYNINTGILTDASFTPNAYGHANGMAYNPNTEHLYVASMNSTGEVYVFDKSFNLVDTLYARDNNNSIFNCWNIAYDRKNMRFITLTGNKLMFLNNNFIYQSHVDCTASEVFPYTAQDIETDGEFVYTVGYNPNTIGVVSMKGKLVKMISNTAFSGEPESMCYDWINDKYYIEGKSSYFVIRQAEFIEQT